jgi:hypothetical protein
MMPETSGVVGLLGDSVLGLLDLDLQVMKAQCLVYL